MQPTIKLSKLVKEARHLGCDIFSSIVDVVAARNWLKRISITLTNMELDDELKLRVIIELMVKSATTWCDNLKLSSTSPVT